LFGLILKIFTFLLLSILLSIIPVNRSYIQDSGGIDVYISSNGVHTDFVLPVNTAIIDWQDFFSPEHFKKGWPYATYVAFGWGDKGFYLKTPEWKDLKMKTAINALFLPSTSTMHVSLWTKPEEDDLTIKVCLTDDEYQKIVDYILISFKLGPDNKIIKIEHPGYGDYDLFFESSLKFHLFKTCNVWTNQGLKKAGIRTSMWTPYDRPLLYQLSQIPGK